MLQHRALPTAGVKTPALPELFGTAEALARVTCQR